MRTRGSHSQDPCAGVSQVRLPQPTRVPSYRHLVTSQEMRELDEALIRGEVPYDFETKLRRLAAGTTGHCFIEQQCRTIIAFLQALGSGSYRIADGSDCEALLRALAYVRKTDDAIPDYREDGFVDDQRELRAVLAEFGPILHEFKEWRLRHQVPRLWTPEKPT